VLAGLRDAWLALRGAAIAMITKGFILAKDYSLIGAKILRDHGQASWFTRLRETGGAAGAARR
jgi:hypothetical protein